MKKLIVMLIVCAFILSGCHDKFRYYGKYPECFSVAVYNLLGITGHEMDEIKVLDQDSKGRILFSFYSWGFSIGENPDLYSVLICQKTDDEYVYFYPDYQFVLSSTKNGISEKEIDELKEKNDWGKELDESKMLRARITKKKKNATSVVKPKERQIFTDLIDFEVETVVMIRLGMDKNKRNLYYVSVCNRTAESGFGFDRAYMLIINEDNSFDGSHCLQELEDPWKYQDQLKAFKELNDWVLSEE